MRFILSPLLAVTVLATATLLAQDTAALNEAIRQHRMGTLIIEAKPGTKVQVEQLRHEFWFGCALANQAFDGTMDPADAARYKAAFLQKFNSAVTENALKWLDMERERGEVNYATVDAILAWCDRSGLPLRGHNIYWGSEHWVQPWLKALDDTALRAALQARGEDIARRYKGRFAEYDFNNEMIHGDYYADRLGAGITREMADWVLAQDSDAKLWVNDYDILTGRRLADYVAHIGQLKAAGIPIAGIGVQGHLHGDSFDPAALQNALDELGKLGLPIRVTEFSFPGQRSKFHNRGDIAITPEEEEAKARAIVDYYRICFAHPSVSGILMWGFWEGANWIPQSSLYRRDWSPTPAAIAYHNLVYKEWWTRAELKMEKPGRAEVPAFYGTYRITAGKKAETIILRRTDGTTTINLR
ncbi:MAG: endo-1,4-beta-xylanase [Opitutaceae bacterium]|nr:endo-1,4-beta-xylanase [Opitutaceae bacterium]